MLASEVSCSHPPGYYMVLCTTKSSTSEKAISKHHFEFIGKTPSAVPLATFHLLFLFNVAPQ